MCEKSFKGSNKELKQLFLCDDCSKFTPDMFIVANNEWKKVVGKKCLRLYLCEYCYDIRRIKKEVPKGPRRFIQGRFSK